jgi:hypothetical protein
MFLALFRSEMSRSASSARAVRRAHWRKSTCHFILQINHLKKAQNKQKDIIELSNDSSNIFFATGLLDEAQVNKLIVSPQVPFVVQ